MPSSGKPLRTVSYILPLTNSEVKSKEFFYFLSSSKNCIEEKENKTPSATEENVTILHQM